MYSKQILNIIPCLNQYAQHSVCFCAWTCCHALCHLLLNHTGATRYEFLVLHHLKEYLTGDIVWIVACEHEGFAIEHVCKIHLKKVPLDDIVAKLREMLMKIWHRLEVYLHHLERTVFLNYILCQHTHSWPYFQYGDVRTSVHGVCNVACHFKVCKEVLT